MTLAAPDTINENIADPGVTVPASHHRRGLSSIQRVPSALAGWLRRHPVEAAFWSAAVVVRVGVMAAYWPAVLQWVDSTRYARTDGWTAFNDPWVPAGYAGFLAALRVVSEQLAFVTIVQHGLGLVSAGLLAGVAHRCGIRRPWNLLAAAPLAFGGDYIFLEHIMLSETVFILTIAVAVYAGTRCLEERRARWAIVASIALAASSLVRSNALILMAVLPLCLLSVRHLLRGWRVLVAAVVPGVVVLVGYLVLATSVGPYVGMEMSGWLLYTRVGSFAECDRIDADEQEPDLAILCETIPPAQRPGPYFYTWTLASPGRAAWGLDPERSDDLRRFSVDVMLNQPGPYVHAIAEDLIRVVDPGFRSGPGHGQALETFEFDYYNPDVDRIITASLSQEYSGVSARPRALGLLTAYQKATRLPGVVSPLAVLLALVGLVRLSGTRRRQVLLPLLVGLVLLLGPIALLTWDYRYTLPALPFLMLSALIGVLGNKTATVERISTSAEPDEPPLATETDADAPAYGSGPHVHSGRPAPDVTPASNERVLEQTGR